MSLLITYGTRPEWIKIKPIIKVMEQEGLDFRILFTGQHANIIGSRNDYKLDVKSNTGNRLNDILIDCLNIDNSIFNGVKAIMVQGDTTSVLGLALSAMHNKVDVIHLEAGLRTHDKLNPYPEEYNRLLTSSIANIHLCPTNTNAGNLFSENVKDNIYVVGNTVLDNLLDIREKCEYEDKVLITLHRRENHDIIDKWFTELDKLASHYDDIEFLLPAHPNPMILQKSKNLKNIKVVEPMGHEDLIEYLSKCKLVITDSGGIQEESSFLNKKVLVCRKTSERQESLGTSSFLVGEPKQIHRIFKEHINDYNINKECPFGDGHSSTRIVEIIRNHYFK